MYLSLPLAHMLQINFLSLRQVNHVCTAVVGLEALLSSPLVQFIFSCKLAMMQTCSRLDKHEDRKKGQKDDSNESWC